MQLVLNAYGKGYTCVILTLEDTKESHKVKVLKGVVPHYKCPINLNALKCQSISGIFVVLVKRTW